MELIKINQEELNRIIENHKHWLNRDCDDWERMRANLSYMDLSDVGLSYIDLSYANLKYADFGNANLSCANLSNADLRCTNLRYANLKYADFGNANLSCANLSNADLRCTNLRYANLKYADLSDADLSCAKLSNAGLSDANLIDANLSEADLSYADLSDANLTYANLTYANLSEADLSEADLSGTNLSNANLSYANLSEACYNCITSFLSLQCPEKGSFIGYKKSGNKIVELRIEEDSKRSSATSRKCRASKVTVLSITSIDGTEEFEKAENTGEHSFTYEVGKTYEVNDFDDNRWNECSTGIHFFITKDEAVKY